MNLYHGTDLNSAKSICNNQIDVAIGSKHVDFGQGFYTTDDATQAKKWAKRKARFRNGRAALVTVLFDEKKAASYIERFSDDLRWGQFIVNNRNGPKYISGVSFKENNLDARYHITCGRIADIEVVDVANELRSIRKPLESVERIFNKDYPMQYVFHTDFALTFIFGIKYRIL